MGRARTFRECLCLHMNGPSGTARANHGAKHRGRGRRRLGERLTEWIPKCKNVAYSTGRDDMQQGRVEGGSGVDDILCLINKPQTGLVHIEARCL